MRYISGLVFLIVVAYLTWPYVQVYRLDKAAQNNDLTTLTKLVDLESVRRIHKEVLERNIRAVVGPQDNVFSDIIREGTRIFGNTAVNTVVDIEWVQSRLQADPNHSLIQDMTFAFFESPTRFTIRIGELGRNPVHVQMILQDWIWRVVAIYE